MNDDKRNLENSEAESTQKPAADQQTEVQQTSTEQSENPQEGSQWSNYRTREMGPDQTPANDSNTTQSNEGGGTLY